MTSRQIAEKLCHLHNDKTREAMTIFVSPEKKDYLVAVAYLGQLLFSLSIKTKLMVGPLMIILNEKTIICSQTMDVYVE